MLGKVAKRLSKGGLDFERAEAREALAKEGVEGEAVDGFLFALSRTVPGVRNTDFGRYRLPENWQTAFRHRLWRCKLTLDILEAEALAKLLDEHGSTDDLGEVRQKLFAELGALDG